MMIDREGSATEIIAFASGKGGTGKTSLIAALGYALIYSGHKVLMVDADRATDGLSLFLLGPEGMYQVDEIASESTFAGVLHAFQTEGTIQSIQHELNRKADHGCLYNAIISGKTLYGDVSAPARSNLLMGDIDRKVFQEAVYRLFEELKSRRAYDYILVDSRGGFSFESTDVCAAADSLVVVTEATTTNFYQDRNLLNRITNAAAQMKTKPLLRGIIINKSME